MEKIIVAALLAMVSLAVLAHAEGCDALSTDADKLFCADPLLKAVDGEVLRLQQWNLKEEPQNQDNTVDREADHEVWLVQRRACARKLDPRSCYLELALQRIDDIRRMSVKAREHDDKGVSRGPYSLDCGEVAYSVIDLNTKPALTGVLRPFAAFVFERRKEGETLVHEGKDELRYVVNADGSATLRLYGGTDECQIGEAGD